MNQLVIHLLVIVVDQLKPKITDVTDTDPLHLILLIESKS